MNKVKKHFNICKQVAESGESADGYRRYRLGSVGLRSDGAIARASNICTRKPNRLAHAEARCIKKLDYGSTIFVVRIGRDGSLQQARPCKACRKLMEQRGIARCYYSIGEREYGILEFS